MSINRRLTNLERRVPRPVQPHISDAELAARFHADYERLRAAGYITDTGEVSPTCPAADRSMAILLGIVTQPLS